MPFEAVEVRITGRAEGDLGSMVERGPDGPGPEVEERRRAIVDLPWTWLRQVHGREVVDVSQPGGGAGATADAAVTDQPGVALAVVTADCAPIALSSPEGVIGVAHAGWRGLAEGVIEATVSAMRDKGASRVEAWLGPCIHPGCYEFSPGDLDEVAARLGPHVRSVTSTGAPALDLPGAVRAELEGVGADLVVDSSSCTACARGRDGDPSWFSYRARGDESRQALVIWRT